MPNIGDILPKHFSIECMTPEGVHIRSGRCADMVDFYSWQRIDYIIENKYRFNDYRNSIVVSDIAGCRAYLKANPDNKIYTIKMVRDLLNCGLKDAKDIVEGWC